MTQSPDKLEIPEAAVEALCKAHDRITGTILGTQVAREMLRASLPHMPDRGYAEVGVKALEWEERAWWDGTKSRSEPFVWRGLGLGCRYEIDASRKDRVVARHNDKSFGEFQTEDEAKAAAQADFETRVRSALIAPPAPADNGEPPAGEDNSIDRQAPEAQRKQSDRNSPIEDVAEPSELATEAALLVKRLETMQANAAHFGELLWHPESPLAESIIKVKTLAARRISEFDLQQYKVIGMINRMTLAWVLRKIHPHTTLGELVVLADEIMSA